MKLNKFYLNIMLSAIIPMDKYRDFILKIALHLYIFYVNVWMLEWNMIMFVTSSV